MIKTLKLVKIGLFIGCCVFALLLFTGYVKPKRPEGTPKFHIRQYEDFVSYKTDFTKMVWEGYEIQHQSESYNRNDYTYHWTVIYVKR